MATQLRPFLAEHWPTALDQVIAALPPQLEATEGVAALWEAWPLCQLIEDHGLGFPAESLAGMHHLTRRWSCEFAVRPYLLAHTDMALEVLHTYARDPDPHVRRLASEGSRTRLPWGQQLPNFIDNPGPVVALIERLKDDPELYVRRSVANNFNDLVWLSA